MDTKDPQMQSFRAGDFVRRKPAPRAPQVSPVEGDLQSFPFLEQLLEASEEDVERFQAACQATCRNLDAVLLRADAPETTAMVQAALSAYGHSLKLFAELLELKYSRLREAAEAGQEG